MIAALNGLWRLAWKFISRQSTATAYRKFSSSSAVYLKGVGPRYLSQTLFSILRLFEEEEDMSISGLSETVSRQTFPKVLFLVIGMIGVMLLLPACQSVSPPTSSESAPATTEPAMSEPSPNTEGGGDIRVLWGKPSNLNPLFTPAGYQQQVIRLTLGSLFKLDDKLEPKPELAEKWEISPDGAKYRV